MTRIVINGTEIDVPNEYSRVGKAAGPTPGKIGNAWKKGSKWIHGRDDSPLGGDFMAPRKLVQWESAHQWAKVNGVLIPDYTSLWEIDEAFGPAGNATYVLEEGRQTASTGGGYNDCYLVSTQQLWDAIDVAGNGGLVVVIHYQLEAVNNGAFSSVYFRIVDDANFANNKRYNAAFINEPNAAFSLRSMRASGGVQQSVPFVDAADHKTSIRMTDTKLEFAANGGAVVKYTSIQPNLAGSNFLVLEQESGSDAGVPGSAGKSTVHHVTFYDPADVPDDAALSALSA